MPNLKFPHWQLGWKGQYAGKYFPVKSSTFVVLTRIFIQRGFLTIAFVLKIDQGEWKICCGKMKLDREKLVQELCTSFTRRDSMKLKFYMPKGEQNMLGQRLYKLKRGFWPWALIQKIFKVTTKPFLINTVWMKFEPYLSKRRKNTWHKWNKRQTDSLINITHPEVMPFTSQC